MTNSIAAPQVSVRSSSSFTASFVGPAKLGRRADRRAAAGGAGGRGAGEHVEQRVVRVDANPQVLDRPVAAEVVFAQQAEVVVGGVELFGGPVLVAFDRRDDAFEFFGGEGRRRRDGDVLAERAVEPGKEFGAVRVGGAKPPSGRRCELAESMARRGMSSAGRRSSGRRP